MKKTPANPVHAKASFAAIAIAAALHAAPAAADTPGAGQGTGALSTADRIDFRYPDEAAADNPTQPPAAMAVEPSVSETPALFRPVADPGYDETGVASRYGDGFDGRPTSNGEIFDQAGMTAAHPSLPLPSLVQVTNLENGREVVLRVNDRGPFQNNSLMEVSKRPADVLKFGDRAPEVRVRYLGPAPSAKPEPKPQVLAKPEAPKAVAPKPRTTRKPEPILASAPAPIPAAPAPNIARSAPHFIQVGSFSDISNARRLHTALSSGLEVQIVPARVNGADYFRVMVGPISGRDAATVMRDHLREQGIANGLVVAAR